MLLEKGSLWHHKDVEGITALHLSAHHKSSKCLALLLKELQPGQVDIQDSNKRTALHWSAKYCSGPSIQLLLKMEANVCIPDVDGKTPLHWVAACNSPSAPECVKMLVNESPGVINWQDYEGRSALHCAVATGTTETVDILTAKEKCNINLLDNMFRTPLHWASALGFSSKASLLLDRGADYLSTDGNGARPLHYAAQGNHAETVASFLSRCYVKDEPDFEGFTALMWAAATQAGDVIQVMFDYGIDLSSKDRNGTTALHAAASQGHVGTIDLLLDLGAKIDARDKEEMTPLLRACEMGRVKAVQLLFERGANLFAVDVDGQTALHWASRGGHAYLCQILLQHSIDISSKDFYGRTALMYASFCGYMNCMSVMLENKANPDCYDHEGKTALQWACIRGNLDAVRLLLEYGADVNFLSVGQERLTPLDYALSGEHQDVVQCLQEHGGISRVHFREAAAVKIQAYYRGYKVRNSLKKEKRDLPDRQVVTREATAQEQARNSLLDGGTGGDRRDSEMAPCDSGGESIRQNCRGTLQMSVRSSLHLPGDVNGRIGPANPLDRHSGQPSTESKILGCSGEPGKDLPGESQFFWAYQSGEIKPFWKSMSFFDRGELDRFQKHVYCAKCGKDVLGEVLQPSGEVESLPAGVVQPTWMRMRSKIDKNILKILGDEVHIRKLEERWAKTIANVQVEVIPTTGSSTN